MTNQPIPNGTRCRYKHRNDPTAYALIDPVMTLVRPHPRLSATCCEIRARDGYLTWVLWADLYVLVEP